MIVSLQALAQSHEVSSQFILSIEEYLSVLVGTTPTTMGLSLFRIFCESITQGCECIALELAKVLKRFLSAACGAKRLYGAKFLIIHQRTP